MSIVKILGTLGTALLLAAASPVRAEEQLGKVVMGQINLSFYGVTGAVVQEVLVQLGHTVEVTLGSHGQIFPRLGAGEVDLLVAAWLPHGHAQYWQQYGANAEPIAVLYNGARFGWMVPTYIPEALVSSVDDLKKPEVLAQMEKDIRGTGRDSGNMLVSAEVMKAYGLEAAGYRLVPGTVPEFHRNYDRAIAEQRWFVMPLWWPHYINKLGTMRAIAEPKGLLGEPNFGTLVASKAWVARAPARTLQVLGRMHLGLDAVAAMDYWVNVKGMTPRDAARQWMQRNPALVGDWFKQG
jgi:glycine betaine/proline transport system substrate-binding protein